MFLTDFHTDTSIYTNIKWMNKNFNNLKSWFNKHDWNSNGMINTIKFQLKLLLILTLFVFIKFLLKTIVYQKT